MNINLMLFGSLISTILCKMYFDILHLQTKLEQSNLEIARLSALNELTAKSNIAMQKMLEAQNMQINSMQNVVSFNTDLFTSQNAVLCTLSVITLGLVVFCIFFSPTNSSISEIVQNSVTKIGSELSENQLTTVGDALKVMAKRNEELSSNLSDLIIATKYAFLEGQSSQEKFIDLAQAAALDSAATVGSTIETTTSLLS